MPKKCQKWEFLLARQPTCLHRGPFLCVSQSFSILSLPAFAPALSPASMERASRNPTPALSMSTGTESSNRSRLSPATPRRTHTRLSHTLIRSWPGPQPSRKSEPTRTRDRNCWRYVKEALLKSGAVDSYPQTVLARQAGDELVTATGSSAWRCTGSLFKPQWARCWFMEQAVLPATWKSAPQMVSRATLGQRRRRNDR